ncbi:MAG: polyprenyl synthetase family protein [Candidatus Omnitrophica bacterium]|nr:polyprenyl synthetase family protein [Candidatus Omnitrophota bacterium]
MLAPVLNLPRPAPLPRFRPPHKNIPQTKIERDHLLRTIRHYVAGKPLTPPLSMHELDLHAQQILSGTQTDPIYRNYVTILINNEIWREPLAAVPYHRRLLLLPKCLRLETKCPALFDGFGLLCRQCGLCSIQDLQAEGERLGYAVLVAEGSAVVMSLIQTGKIEAIIGVSCMSVLEQAFPYMEAAAIPGLAIPLLQDDCQDTTVDLDWVWEVIHLTSEDRTRRLDLIGLREEVESWFTLDALEKTMGPAQNETELLARGWLARAGKRWRPFLTVAAYQAMRDQPESALPFDLRRIALAVECFHKASLIHDDIEDEDQFRYGEKTLHAEHGIPVALNVGDLLIGEGYRLIAASEVDSDRKAEMLWVAAEGQRKLCAGQGAELAWMRHPEPLSSLRVLDIFRNKTAPAFAVSLLLGTIYAGSHEAVADVIREFSEALGIAYQIRDDLNDLGGGVESNDLTAMRPSLLLAIAYERARGEPKSVLEALWRRSLKDGITIDQIERWFGQFKADQRARQLLETFKEEAVRSLHKLDHASLKGLLRRVIGKIFNPTEIKGWCHQVEAQKGGGRLPIADAAG